MLASVCLTALQIKQIIDSMDSEFSVIKKERDATKEVVQEIYEKLKKAQVRTLSKSPRWQYAREQCSVQSFGLCKPCKPRCCQHSSLPV